MMSDVIDYVLKSKGYRTTAECMVERSVTLIFIHDRNTDSRHFKESQNLADKYMDYVDSSDLDMNRLIH